jgi:hypothetical protein
VGSPRHSGGDSLISPFRCAFDSEHEEAKNEDFSSFFASSCSTFVAQTLAKLLKHSPWANISKTNRLQKGAAKKQWQKMLDS